MAGLGRRGFLRGGTALASGLLPGAAAWGVQTAAGGVPPALGEGAAPVLAKNGDRFVFAVIADSHVIDRYYVPGAESGTEDNQSLLHANERLRAVRETINGIRLRDGRRVEQVFLVGDCFHNYPSAEMAFYQTHETRIDLVREILDGFRAPVHLGFGNHDYGVPQVSREMSHRLFREKLRAEPYMSVDVGGIRFLQLNNFLGSTWESGSPAFSPGVGSLGQTQLEWAEAQLAARRPTVVFVHYPLWLVQPTEVGDFGLHPLLRKYQETVLMVISGHWHKWVDFAHTFGPQHTVSAATRYDPNAFMLFAADGRRGTVEWLDRSRPEWSTHFATAYREGMA